MCLPSLTTKRLSLTKSTFIVLVERPVLDAADEPALLPQNLTVRSSSKPRNLPESKVPKLSNDKSL